MDGYNYNVDEDIDLSDYEFEAMSVDSVLEDKPQPSTYRFSTKTVNVQLFPVLNFQKRIDYIRSDILPKYELELTDKQLKEIILTRIIRDGISFEQFFLILSQRSKKTSIDELIPSIIKTKNSQMVNIDTIYHKTEITDDKFQLVWLYKHKPRFDIDMLTKKNIKLPPSVLAGKDGFRNQVTLRFFSRDKKRILNVMAFRNGKLTISGVRDASDLIYTINQMIEHIKSIDAVSYKDLYVHHITYQSVNTHFDLNFQLNNRKLHSCFQAETSEIIRKIEMNPSSQADLKVRFHSINERDKELEECKHVINHSRRSYYVDYQRPDRKGSSVTFFQTGKVNIYGSSSAEEVQQLYDIINELMTKYYPEIVI